MLWWSYVGGCQGLVGAWNGRRNGLIAEKLDMGVSRDQQTSNCWMQVVVQDQAGKLTRGYSQVQGEIGIQRIHGEERSWFQRNFLFGG